MKPVKKDRSRERAVVFDKEKRKGNGGANFRKADRYAILAAAAILVITLLCYLPSLHNDLMKTWDDQAYVTNNHLVKDLSANGDRKSVV